MEPSIDGDKVPDTPKSKLRRLSELRRLESAGHLGEPKRKNAGAPSTADRWTAMFVAQESDGASPKKHVLELLRATANHDRPSDFGSIRFPGSRRPMPSKYARVASSTDHIELAMHPGVVADGPRPKLLELLIDTWGLNAPCAVISVLGRSGAVRDPMDPTNVFKDTKEQLIFARGLADAAATTNAWVVTDGLYGGVASMCGRALRESNVPLLGVTPWQCIAKHSEIAQQPNSSVYLYEETPSSETPVRDGQHMLERNHTHFLFVDDGEAAQLGSELPLREAMELYLSKNDVSHDFVRTPTVFLVIGGDESTLLTVVDALKSTGSKSGSAESVLVLSDSGGAAHDIHVYCKGGALTLPTVGDCRSAAYVEAAAKLLPEVLRLGNMTGRTPTPQLTFFSAESADTFDLAVQQAVLKDCQTSLEEIMLSVAWGDPITLQAQLEKAQPGEVELALEVALLNTDLPTVQLLLSFNATPANVRLKNLFCERLNRYAAPLPASGATQTCTSQDY